MSNEIIVLCGPSAVGKDSIANILIKDYGYKSAVSHTTRPMREGEVQDVTYHFIDKDTFLSMEFLEYRLYNTLVGGIPDIWYYGVHESEFEEHSKYVLIVDLQGLLQILQCDKVKGRILPFYIDIDGDIRKERAMKRGSFDESEWNRRLLDDSQAFAEVEQHVKRTIINNNLTDSVQQILKAVNDN